MKYGTKHNASFFFTEGIDGSKKWRRDGFSLFFGSFVIFCNDDPWTLK